MRKKFGKAVMLLLAALLLMVGCSYEADEPAASPTGTPAPISTPVPTPEPEPALAICMNVIDHPIHRQVQLGFLDGCKELGYEDVSIIGTVTGGQKEQFNAALEWAKSVEGRPAALLLWNGDHTSDELCEKLGEMGVYVGIPFFAIFADGDEDRIMYSTDNIWDEIELPEGICFEYSISDYQMGRYAAEYMANKLEGKSGSVICIGKQMGGTFNYYLQGFEEGFEELKEKGEHDLSRIELADSYAYSIAVNNAERIFEENDDVIGIFASESETAAGVAEECAKRGIAKEDVLIAGIEITEPLVQMYGQADFDLLIGIPYYYSGYKCAQNFDKLFKGEYVPKFEFIEPEYLNEDTADELLPKYKELFERTKDEEFFESYKAKSFVGE